MSAMVVLVEAEVSSNVLVDAEVSSLALNAVFVSKQDKGVFSSYFSRLVFDYIL